MIGQRLLHYQIVVKLGEGGMGVVYKARDTHLDRFVAIKVLPPEKVSDPTRKARFIQEAKAASALNHPNIITIYDISNANDVDFIAMEYVDGKTLDQLIPRKGMRLNEALKIAIQIADALARAHAAGIIHRDLKPANIMVDAHGQVKVLDFGLAKLTGQRFSSDDTTLTGRPETGEGAVLGTTAYMSPEQAEGKPVDARSDTFSFGSVLYEMLTGQRAFTGSSTVSTLAAILKEQPRPPHDLAAGIPQEVERLALRCLQKDPARRWQTMADLHVALAELRAESGSQPGAARRLTASRAWRWSLALAVPVVLVTLWLLWLMPASLPPVRLEQLTSFKGDETQASFSPDGSNISFAWAGEAGDNLDIYAKPVGEATALRLTTDPAADQQPAWSPDGRRIAFQRATAGPAAGIYLVSPLGGPEQKLSGMRPLVGQMAWSPDGRWLAVARGTQYNSALYLVPAVGGDPIALPPPKAPGWQWSPAFSPDGRRLAFASCRGIVTCDVHVLDLKPDGTPAGQLRPITRQGVYITGVAWSRDGRSVVFSASLTVGTVNRLYRARADGRRSPERLDFAGSHAVEPAIAPANHRLAFTESRFDIDLMQVGPGEEPRPLVATSLVETHPDFSPDGRQIAFSSTQGGETFEIWVAAADGSNRRQLTRRIGRYQSSPRWSPNGQFLAFDSQGEDGHWGVYVVAANGLNPRRLTESGIDSSQPFWSRDGKWIYFRSSRGGRPEVWRMPSAGGPAEKLTRSGGYTPMESHDSKTLFFMKGTHSPLFAQPLAGGPERQLVDMVLFRAYAVVEDGIYYVGRRGTDGKFALNFHRFLGNATSEIARLDSASTFGLAVSPDRRTVVYNRLISSGADLMLVENFR